MKLVSFRTSGAVKLGAVVDDSVVPINALLDRSEQVPDDMVAFLTAGDVAMQSARKAVDAFRRGGAASQPLHSDAPCHGL